MPRIVRIALLGALLVPPTASADAVGYDLTAGDHNRRVGSFTRDLRRGVTHRASSTARLLDRGPG